MAKKLSALDSAITNVKQWGQNIFTDRFPAPKIISPLSEANTLDTPGKLNLVRQNQAGEEWARRTRNDPTPTPMKLQYPESLANAASPKAMDAIKTLRAANPNIKMSDADIAVQYNKYGDRLLQGLRAGQAIQTTPTPTATPTPRQVSTPAQGITQPQFQYQKQIEEASRSSGISLDSFHLLRAGENQAEDPRAINQNSNGTLDVGLFQINVAANNIAEIERLKNPVYNAMRAAQIFAQRLKLLQDPVLALASYNLGAGGAVLRPIDALKRAEWVYWKAGIEMPQTEFTQDPLGYVRQRMDTYRSLGLFK